MSLATILPGGSVRILVYDHLATGGRTGIDGRGDNQCSRHRITPLRCVSVPISMAAVGVSIRILSTVGLGSAGASPRAVRMSGLSVAILRSDFAMLREGGKEKEPSQPNRLFGGWTIRAGEITVPHSLPQQRWPSRKPSNRSCVAPRRRDRATWGAGGSSMNER